MKLLLLEGYCYENFKIKFYVNKAEIMPCLYLKRWCKGMLKGLLKLVLELSPRNFINTKKSTKFLSSSRHCDKGYALVSGSLKLYLKWKNIC